MRVVFWIALMSSFVLSVAHGEDLTNDGGSYFMCKNGKAVRTIRVEKNSGSCRATYTKEGVDSVVAKNSKFDKCQDVADRIRSHLETGNWSCRDISAARLSSSQ